MQQIAFLEREDLTRGYSQIKSKHFFFWSPQIKSCDSSAILETPKYNIRNTCTLDTILAGGLCGKLPQRYQMFCKIYLNENCRLINFQNLKRKPLVTYSVKTCMLITYKNAPHLGHFLKLLDHSGWSQLKKKIKCIIFIAKI